MESNIFMISIHVYFILEQTCENQHYFYIFKDQKKKSFLKKILDVLGAEKQVINLERPNGLKMFFSL